MEAFIGIMIGLEILFAAAIIILIILEDHVIDFEDSVRRAVVHFFRRKKFSIKYSFLKGMRSVYLSVYGFQRQLKKKVLRRLLNEFGLKAVKR